MRGLRPPGRVPQDHALDQRRAPRGPAHLRKGRLSPGARGAPPQLRARSRWPDVGADVMTDRDGFKDHFSATAAAYAAHRPTYPAALTDFLGEIAPPANLAWDAGCGSGQLSVLLADRFSRVIATDASTEQIAHATPRPHVAYVVARAESCALADGTVDVAVGAQAAHWFDLPAYYAEVWRLGRAGGGVARVIHGPVRVADVRALVMVRSCSKFVSPDLP